MISIFTYSPVTAYDANDSLQRFGRLKIEATSFTISEPTASLEIAPMLYDLAVMIRQPNIQSLLTDDEMIKKLLDIRIKEEAGRLDGIPGVMPQEFSFFDAARDNDGVRKACAVMQAQYVLRSKDKIEYDAP